MLLNARAYEKEFQDDDDSGIEEEKSDSGEMSDDGVVDLDEQVDGPKAKKRKSTQGNSNQATDKAVQEERTLFVR